MKGLVVSFFAGLVALVVAQVGTPDGSCGGTNGFVCTTPDFGVCCSAQGFCGNTTAHCGGGCQAAYGTCSGNNETPDGTCGGTTGYTCYDAFGLCCSANGFCGDSTAYCGSGCQTPYSATNSCLTGSLPSIDGTCGATSTANYTCAGGAFDGSCCSRLGFCGTGSQYCSTFGGCQAGYGAACTTP